MTRWSHDVPCETELEVWKARHEGVTVMLELERADNDRLREALRRIASAESGPWGRIAHSALHPKEKSR
jgi:hypothetical protein